MPQFYMNTWPTDPLQLCFWMTHTGDPFLIHLALFDHPAPRRPRQVGFASFHFEDGNAYISQRMGRMGGPETCVFFPQVDYDGTMMAL